MWMLGFMPWRSCKIVAKTSSFFAELLFGHINAIKKDAHARGLGRIMAQNLLKLRPPLLGIERAL